MRSSRASALDRARSACPRPRERRELLRARWPRRAAATPSIRLRCGAARPRARGRSGVAVGRASARPRHGLRRRAEQNIDMLQEHGYPLQHRGRLSAQGTVLNRPDGLSSRCKAHAVRTLHHNRRMRRTLLGCARRSRPALLARRSRGRSLRRPEPPQPELARALAVRTSAGPRGAVAVDLATGKTVVRAQRAAALAPGLEREARAHLRGARRRSGRPSGSRRACSATGDRGRQRLARETSSCGATATRRSRATACTRWPRQVRRPGSAG